MRKIISVWFLIISSFVAVPAAAFEKMYPFGTWGEPIGNWSILEHELFFEEWFGNQLRAMNEQPLWGASASPLDITVIRLLVLPSFNNGTMVRVTLGPDRPTVYEFKRLSGAGGYEPGELIETQTGQVSNEHLGQLAQKMKEISPFVGEIVIETTGSNCFDGTTVVFEFARGAQYSAIERHECSMPTNGPLRHFVHVLNNVSGQKLIYPETFEFLPK